jgi:hypothetical protein
VRAPLNSRVGASASIPKTKGKAKEDVLDNLPVDIQEALILEDLLYVLMVCRVVVMCEVYGCFFGIRRNNYHLVCVRCSVTVLALLLFDLFPFLRFVSYSTNNYNNDRTFGAPA